MEPPLKGYFKAGNAMAFDRNLSNGSYRLYGQLRAIARGDSTIEGITEEELAILIGASVKTVQRQLKELQTLGYLTQARRGSRRFSVELVPDGFGLEHDIFVQ